MPLLTVLSAAALLASGPLKLTEPKLDWRLAGAVASAETSSAATLRYPDPPLLEEIPAPPPPPVAPQLTFAPDRLTGAEARLHYFAREKSALGALVLEMFTFPGVGLAYANAWPELVITLCTLTAGAGMVVVAATSGTRSFETFLAVGALLVAGSRVFGVVASYFGVQRFNEQLRQELGLTPELLLAPQPGGGMGALTLRFDGP